MEFKRVNPDCRFTIPDVITVRQQLAFFSASLVSGSPEYHEQLWNGAQPLIQEWECPALPDRRIDLGSTSSPDVTKVILWAGAQVRNFLNEKVFSVPKN